MLEALAEHDAGWHGGEGFNEHDAVAVDPPGGDIARVVNVAATETEEEEEPATV